MSMNISAEQVAKGDRITAPPPAGTPATAAPAGREVTSVPTLTGGRVHFTTVDGGGNRRIEEFPAGLGMVVSR